MYVQPEEWLNANAVLLFLLALASVVPLAYLIGMALASITAQTSFALGAILNASFGSIIDVFLFFFAIPQPFGPELVVKGLIGGLLVVRMREGGSFPG
jgi:Ca2+:H+ antiporter